MGSFILIRLVSFQDGLVEVRHPRPTHAVRNFSILNTFGRAELESGADENSR
jgi:hypothetical protein